MIVIEAHFREDGSAHIPEGREFPNPNFGIHFNGFVYSIFETEEERDSFYFINGIFIEPT